MADTYVDRAVRQHRIPPLPYACGAEEDTGEPRGTVTLLKHPVRVLEEIVFCKRVEDDGRPSEPGRDLP